MPFNRCKWFANAVDGKIYMSFSYVVACHCLCYARRQKDIMYTAF